MSTAVCDRPAPSPLPVEPPARPCLSAAIRTGVQYHPQGMGHVYNPYTETTCALGALAAGLLGKEAFERSAWKGRLVALVYTQTGVLLDTPRPELARDPVLEPWYRKKRKDECTLARAIAYLNDGPGWSREAIADWLQSKGF